MASEAVKMFRVQYNHWKKANSALGKYAPTEELNDATSTGLENMVICYFKMTKHGYCAKVDVKGNMRNGVWHTSGSTKGVSDLIATYYGIVIYIEVKIGKDTQKKGQKKFEANVTQALANYVIIKNFDDFLRKVVPILKVIALNRTVLKSLFNLSKIDQSG